MKLLIIDPFPEKQLGQLQQLPLTVDYRPDISPEEVAEMIGGYEIMIINSKMKIRQPVIDKAHRLQLIVRAGVGMEHLDLEYLSQKGIIVRNIPGGNADSVGEHATGMLLTLMHRIHNADKEIRQFQWNREKNRGTEIGRKTVGIVGYGNTGNAFARCLRGFGCRIIAYDKYKTGFENEWVEEVTEQKIFEESDILSLHIPLDEVTRGMINESYIHRFSKPFVFMNLSRGPIMILPDVVRALDSGMINAAALDVLPNEKFKTLSKAERELYSDLFSRENVILSPHIGGWSFQSLDNISNRVWEIVRDFVSDSQNNSTPELG